MPTCLKQYGKRHGYGAYIRKIVKSLNIFSQRFSSFLDRRKELIYGHLGVILVKWRKEPNFQVDPKCEGF